MATGTVRWFRRRLRFGREAEKEEGPLRRAFVRCGRVFCSGEDDDQDDDEQQGSDADVHALSLPPGVHDSDTRAFGVACTLGGPQWSAT
jgi:hypothetical protein